MECVSQKSMKKVFMSTFGTSHRSKGHERKERKNLFSRRVSVCKLDLSCFQNSATFTLFVCIKFYPRQWQNLHQMAAAQSMTQSTLSPDFPRLILPRMPCSLVLM